MDVHTQWIKTQSVVLLSVWGSIGERSSCFFDHSVVVSLYLLLSFLFFLVYFLCQASFFLPPVVSFIELLLLDTFLCFCSHRLDYLLVSSPASHHIFSVYFYLFSWLLDSLSVYFQFKHLLIFLFFPCLFSFYLCSASLLTFLCIFFCLSRCLLSVFFFLVFLFCCFSLHFCLFFITFCLSYWHFFFSFLAFFFLSFLYIFIIFYSSVLKLF